MLKAIVGAYINAATITKTTKDFPKWEPHCVWYIKVCKRFSNITGTHSKIPASNEQTLYLPALSRG